MDESSRSILVEMLTRLGNGDMRDFEEIGCNRSEGICTFLNSLVADGFITRRAVDSCRLLMPSWPEASGMCLYPVPHPTQDPWFAYHYTEDLWADNEYGDARRRLCSWLANELKRSVEDIK